MIQLRLRTPPHTLRRSLATRPIRGGHRWVEGPKIKVGRTGGRCSCHVPPGDEPAAQGRRPREPICRGRGAGVGKRARRGRGRARPGGAPRGGHARGGGGGSRERDGEAWGVTPAARARSARSAQLGDDEGDHAARSASRGQEPTPSPLSTRVEDRDEPAAQGRPGWRIETSLRRKAVRGGGSRRACGAPVCLRQEGVADAGGASEPSSTSIPIDQARRYPSRASPYCPSEATRTTSRLGPTADLREPSHAGRRPPHNFWRRFQKAFVRWGATATSFGI